jgi:hypothetical protein
LTGGGGQTEGGWPRGALNACRIPVGFRVRVLGRSSFFFASPAPPDALPFAAPNSHSTPKIRHSLTFALLLKNTRATLPHGRHCPGPNPEVPSSPTHRTPFTPDTSLRHPASSNSFASYHIHSTPVFSCIYALFCATATRYLLSLQCLAHSFYRHGGVPQWLSPPCPPRPSAVACPDPVWLANPMFSAVCRLFGLSLRSFSPSCPSFSIVCGLFSQNTRGGGVVRACISALCIAD